MLNRGGKACWRRRKWYSEEALRNRQVLATTSFSLRNAERQCEKVHSETLTSTPSIVWPTTGPVVVTTVGDDDDEATAPPNNISTTSVR